MNNYVCILMLPHTLQKPQSSAAAAAAAPVFRLLAVLFALAHISQRTVCLKSPL
jgi:hypothetical protein